jgi:hypothetical protein
VSGDRGAEVALEEPVDLLRRLKLGREEYCQRLLTMLILDAPYPPWNTTSQPSDLGATFLERLDLRSFGDHSRRAATAFVDELDLPKRHDDESGGAPDYAVVWEDRLWIIELKTEAASHRPGQIPMYFELGRHYYTDHHLDVTYLTPPISKAPPVLPEDTHYAHVTWDHVVGLIDATWGDAEPIHQRIAGVLIEALDGIGTPWRAWKGERVAVPVDEDSAYDATRDAVSLADEVAVSGTQRAIETTPSSLQDLQDLRLEIDKALRAQPDGSPLRRVRPWLWNANSSGGSALTSTGETTGYELRLSRYAAPR